MKIKKRICFFALIMITFEMLAGCGGHQPNMMDDVQTLTVINQKPTDYFIRVNDGLEIKFFYNPELDEKVKVRPDGRISLQLIGEIQAAGLKPSQLDEILTQKYSSELKKPDIAVFVREVAGLVYVGGEVGYPHAIHLEPGMTALAAIMEGGGFKPTGRQESVLIIRKGLDNRPIPITVDFKSTLSGKYGGADYLLEPSDIVYVPKTAIANVHDFMSNYIQKLILFGGWSAGYSLGSIND